MSTNLYKRLMALLPDDPVMTGRVGAVFPDETAQVALVGSLAPVRVRNPLALPVGGAVYVQGGAITGRAPEMPYELIEV